MITVNLYSPVTISNGVSIEICHDGHAFGWIESITFASGSHLTSAFTEFRGFNLEAGLREILEAQRSGVQIIDSLAGYIYILVMGLSTAIGAFLPASARRPVRPSVKRFSRPSARSPVWPAAYSMRPVRSSGSPISRRFWTNRKNGWRPETKTSQARMFSTS